MKILILGGSGQIGRSILESCKKQRITAVATSRTTTHDFRPFCLENQETHQILCEGWSHAIFCCGLSNIDLIKANQKHSRWINVDRIQAALHRCLKYNVIPVFLSSDHVFDGHHAPYKEEDLCRPVNEYGKQKMEIENWLKKNFSTYLIIRSGKVLSHLYDPNDFLQKWIRNLSEGKAINAASDYQNSLISNIDLSNSTLGLMEQKATGIWHISSKDSFSRLRLARLLSSQMEISENLIISCRMNDLKLKEVRPNNTTLDVQKALNALGTLPTTEKIIEHCLASTLAHRK